MKPIEINRYKKQFVSTKSTAKKVEIGFILLKYYLYRNPTECTFYLEAIEPLINSGNVYSKINFAHYKIINLLEKGQYRESEQYAVSVLLDDTLQSFPTEYSHILNAVGKVYSHLREHDKEYDYMFKSMKIMEEHGSEEELSWIYQCLAYNLLNRNKLTEATEYIDKAIRIFDKYDKVYGKIDSYVISGLIEKAKGKNKNALSKYLVAEKIIVHLHQSGGVKSQEGWLYNNMASVYFELNEFEKTVEYLYKARSIFEESNNHSAIALISENLAKLYIRKENYIDGLRELIKAKEVAVKQNLKHRLQQINHTMALVLFEVGEYSDAEMTFVDLLEKGYDVDNERLMLMTILPYGKLLTETKRYEDAIDQLSNGIILAKEIKNNSLLAEYYCQLGFTYLSMGKNLDSFPYFVFAQEHVEKNTISHGEVVLGFSMFLLSIGEYEAAFENMKVATEIEKNVNLYSFSIRYHEFMATLYEKLGQIAPMLNTYKLLTELYKEKENRKNVLSELNRLRSISQEQSLEEILEHLRNENINLRNEVQALRTTVHSSLYSSKMKGETLPSDSDRTERDNIGVDQIVWRKFEHELQIEKPQLINTLLSLCPELSRAELRVCVLLSMQLSTKNIASSLFIDKTTVDKHRQNIRKKLGISSKEDLNLYILKAVNK